MENRINAIIVGLLISTKVYKSVLNVDNILGIIIIITTKNNNSHIIRKPNGNTLISCYSPTHISEEQEVESVYYDLSSLVKQIPKHNIY